MKKLLTALIGTMFLFGFAIQAYANGNPPGPQPIPEPTSMLLLGSGLLGLAAFARGKRNKK